MPKKKAAAAPRAQNKYPAEELIERGNTFLQTGQPELAIRFLDRALQSEPNNTEALDLLGEAYVDIGDYAKATKAFEHSVALAPEEAGTKWMFLGQLSSGRAAFQYYQKGFELMQKLVGHEQQGKQSARAQVAIAELFLTDLCMEEGAEQACEEAVRKAEQFDPTSVEALQTKASMRLSQSRPDEAHEALKIVAQKIIDTPFTERDLPFEFCVQT